MAPETKIQELETLLQTRDYRGLRETLADMNAVDVAQFLQEVPVEQELLCFRTLPKDEAMDVFAELDSDVQQRIIASITDQEVAAIIDELMVDDAVDMLEEMPASLVNRVLQNAPADTRRLINQFLRYPEHSAGSIMTAEYIDLYKTLTVEDAIKRIRRVGEDKETVYTCYVTDGTRRLQGVVTVKDLLLANDAQLVEEIMEEDVIGVSTTEDQEAAAKLMAKYGLIALPVVDAERRLVGIVTVDDALDVIQEEDTEDFERMAGMVPSEKPYLKTSVFALAKNRLPWLLILMLTNTLTALIIGRYEEIYVTLPVLATYVPMLMGTGGNAGSQSSTTIIRGMALGEIRGKDFLAVLWKETRICLLVGVALAIVNFLRVLFLGGGGAMVALLVSLALIASVFVGKTMGSMLPILAKACRIDPAVVAAPLITTMVDTLSLLLYFAMANAMMPLLLT